MTTPQHKCCGFSLCQNRKILSMSRLQNLEHCQEQRFLKPRKSIKDFRGGEIYSIETGHKINQWKIQMEKEIAIVYMVAGISSRFGGRIKQFTKVGPSGETLIEYSLNQALKAGFTKIIFIVGNMTEKPFKEMFGDNYQGTPVYYALQKFDPKKRSRPWGTSDALCSIKEIINCPFVVCNGDDIYGENTFKTLFNHLKESNEEATVGFNLNEAIPEKGAVKRAIFKVNNGYAKRLVEIFGIEKDNLKASRTKPDDLCSMNIFALHPSVVEMLNENLIKFKKEKEGDRDIECLLPNEISRLIENNKAKMKIYPNVNKWIGVTNPEDEEVVRKVLAGS